MAVKSYDFSMNKMVPKGSGMVTSEAVAAGAPLLAMSLLTCWTKSRVCTDCLPVAKALREASARNPLSELLKADATYLKLQLVFDKKNGGTSADRKAFLDQLPAASKDVPGSAKADYDMLVLELGPGVVASLGLTYEEYLWACQVCAKFGLSFAVEAGAPMMVLAPGFELLGGGASAATAKIENGSLFLIAEKAYAAGAAVGFAAALSKPASVACSLTLLHTPMTCTVVDKLMALLAGTETAVSPGSLMPVEVPKPVLAISDGGTTKFKVTLELTKEKPLPSTEVLSLLGVAVLADPLVLKTAMENESKIDPSQPGWRQEQADVLSTATNEKRALGMLQFQLEAMQEDDDSGIVSLALSELSNRLEEPAEPSSSPSSTEDKMVLTMPGSGLSMAWPLDGDMGPETTLGKAMATLKACVKGLEGLASKFAALQKSGKFGDAGKEVLDEFSAVKACMVSAGLGDPAVVTGKPATDSADPAVKAFSEAVAATLKVTIAMTEWEVAGFEKGKKAIEQAKALCKLGASKLKLDDFKGASEALTKSMKLAPSTGAASLALKCAMTTATMSDAVLGAKLDKCGPALVAVKSKFASKGYTADAVPVPQRVPEPLPYAAAALDSELFSEAFLEDCSVSDLAEFVRLFVLHRAMPMKKAVLLLGPKVCTTLLEHGVLSCYNGTTLSPAEGVKLVDHPAQRGTTVVFANVALQPVGGLLVASDFDYSASTIAPVPYVAEDTCALAAACASSGSVADLSCGNGALGLSALLAGASKAALCDSNPRALKFAKFNASLNSLESKASFSASPSGKFDAILASPVRLPNPSKVVTTKGPMYAGGEDGLDALSECIKSSVGMLSKGGMLLAAAMVPNVQGLADKISGLLKGACSTVLPGSAAPAESCLLKSLVTGLFPVQQFAYAAGLKKSGLHTMSQAVLVVCSSEGSMSGKVEMLPASSGLWKNAGSLKKEVGKVLASVASTTEVQSIVAPGSKGSVYEMSWDDDEGSTTADSEEESKPKPAPIGSVWDPKAKSKKALRKKADEMDINMRKEGARWKDIMQIDQYGMSFPINAVSKWFPYPGELPTVEMPEVMPRIAVIELPGCRVPGNLMDAFRDVFDCQLKFTIDSEKQVLKPIVSRSSKRKRRGMAPEEAEKATIDDADIFLIPVPPDDYKDAEPVLLPTQMVYCFQILADKARSGAKISCAILTCNAHPGAPAVDGYRDDVVRAVGLGGMSRTIRLEVPKLNVINLDTDAMAKNGDPLEVCSQLSMELTACDGISEMAYRNGVRWIRQLDLSARNPINPTSEASKWMYGDDGVAIITGGTGGLGVVTAEALAESGCKIIVLTSRTGTVRAGQGLEERFAKLESLGAKIHNVKCDTANEQQIIECLQTSRKLGKIRVIVHAAGVLADQLLDFQNEIHMRASYEPKANGAWWLHEHTVAAKDDIKAFLCFSSTSSLFGNPGQANYSSANAYMDGICDFRVKQGLPGMAFMWPAVFEVGMAAAGIIKGANWVEEMFASPDDVKQCMRRCCNTETPYESLVAVLPIATVFPDSGAAPGGGNASMVKWNAGQYWMSDRLFNAFKLGAPKYKGPC